MWRVLALDLLQAARYLSFLRVLDSVLLTYSDVYVVFYHYPEEKVYSGVSPCLPPLPLGLRQWIALPYTNLFPPSPREAGMVAEGLGTPRVGVYLQSRGGHHRDPDLLDGLSPGLSPPF